MQTLFPRLFALVSLIVLVGCPQTAPTPQTSTTTSQKRKPDARAAAIEKLVAGSSLEETPPEERRIALRIAALMKLHSQMQDVIEELPKEQAAAKELQKKLVELQEKHGKKAMENALTEAAAQLQKAQKSGSPVTDASELKARELLKRAAKVDSALDAALANELQLPSDSKKLKNLKSELKRQQEAALRLAAATRAAFRGLSVLEQMKKAVQLMEKSPQ